MTALFSRSAFSDRPLRSAFTIFALITVLACNCVEFFGGMHIHQMTGHRFAIALLSLPFLVYAMPGTDGETPRYGSTMFYISLIWFACWLFAAISVAGIY